jgi:osmoprotectant transport system permease protein
MSVRFLADNSGTLPSLSHVPTWLNDPENWRGPDGLGNLIVQHVFYTVVAVGIAFVIALPLGLFIGHTGRGVALIGGLANGLRAIPILGLILYLVVTFSGDIHWTKAVPALVDQGALPYFILVEAALALLAIPPVLTNTYAGVQNVDPAVRDAAKGMGMTGAQVVRKVELPCALPLIMSGVRSATLQVIATATVAGYIPLMGGLGRPIFVGIQTINDLHTGYPAVVSAGLVVALLAIVVDVLLIGVQRAIVSPGLNARIATKKPHRRDRVVRKSVVVDANIR